MKRVNFKQVSIKNFLSVGNDPVEVSFKQDINFITGINKDKQDRQNACGKSTIKRGIFWSIFGEDLYGIKSELLINNITKSSTEVELDFDVIENNKTKTYKIIRKLKPSKCQLFENGEEITLSSLALTNKKIYEIISATPEMFSNCVIMSLNDTVPFMSKGKIDKRNFIEQIFNLDFFDNMLKSIRKDFNNQKSKTDISFAKLNESLNHLNQLEQSKTNFESNIHNKKEQIKFCIEKIEKNIKDCKKEDHSKSLRFLQEDLNKLENNLKDKQQELDTFKIEHEKLEKEKSKLNHDLEDLKNKQGKINNNISIIEAELKIANQTLDKFNKLKENKICPVCFSNTEKSEGLINEEKEIKNKIDNFKIKLSKLKEADKKLKNNIVEIETSIKKIQNSEVINQINDCNYIIEKLARDKIKLQSEIKIETNSLDSQNQRINDLETQKERWINILNTIDETNPYIKDIENASKQTEIYETDYKNESDILNLYNAAKLVVSDEGVKSLLIKKVLDIFNSKMAYYLDIMQSNCICKFNEYFEEEITNERGVICSYFNFSGAEKKAIDLACLFSFMDMRLLLANVSYNLVIYDELIDSSLDSKGVDIVLKIIKNRIEKYQEATYIISHRKESLQSITGDIIMLEKSNGITRRIKNPHV